jgi:hypothetical protein
MEIANSNNWKLLPKGVSNFASIRTQNCYYVDKTQYIPLLERSDRFVFFIRPRRFGKSLLIDMLKHYYDVNTENDFSQLFGDLYIGTHPTNGKNSYLVMYLDFSGIEENSGSYRESLDVYCSIAFRSFCERYEHLLPEGTLANLSEYKGAVNQLQYVCDRCSKSGQRVYLFIDEYDHFTNDILSNPSRLSVYEAETHGEGPLRKFFNVIKSNTRECIERCFITGVSPVTLDDLTSGFNIATNYSTSPKFNAMIGFTEEEVRTMLDYYAAATGVFKHTTDELIKIMAPYYDHYCFSKSMYGKETLYNSNMVLFFIINYIDANGEIPADMIDNNIRVDYNKLRMLIRKDSEASTERSIVQTIAQQGYIEGEVKDSFPACEIGDSDNFVSLLFYFGMLTYGGTNEFDEPLLRIPNQVIREQIYTYLLRIYTDEGLKDATTERQKFINRMAMGADFHPVFEGISERLKTYASVRDRMKGESFIHGFCLSSLADSKCYLSDSETDVNAGYTDLLLIARKEVNPRWQHSYLIELKYAKKDAFNEVEALKKEAIEQIHRYVVSPKMQKRLNGTTLHKIVAVFQGFELAVCEEVE